MPITFSCECGKQLRTGDENAGKRVKCPACGDAVTVPAPAKAPAADVVRFPCGCGKQLQARAELAGKRVKCPGCGAELIVPGQANGIQASKPAAKKSSPSATTTRPRPKRDELSDLDDEDEPPRRGRRKYEDEDEPPRKGKRHIEDEDEDDLGDEEEERPRKRKRKPAEKSKAPLIIGLCAVGFLLLVGGSIGAYFLFFKKPDDRPVAQGDGKNNQQNQQQVAADLDLVPRDAVGFATVRIAKVWNDPKTKEQLKATEQMPGMGQMVKGQMQQLEALEKQIGLTLGDVERATVVAFDAEMETFAAIISTTKDCDRKKILDLLPKDLQEKERQGRKYHADKQGAIHFASDRLFIVGSPKGVERLLDRFGQPGGTGPLSDAIKLAADHDLVVGANPPADKVNELRKDLPEEVKPYEALLDAQTISVTLDGISDVQLQVHLGYADEGKAAKAKDAAVAALAFGRTMLAAQKKELAKQPGGQEMVKALEQGEKMLEGLSHQQDGKVVRLGLKFDEKTAQAMSTTLLPLALRLQGAAQQTAATNNLKQLALAMHQYHNAMGRLPVGIRHPQTGQPLLSWRVELLPYLEQGELFKEFHLTEPWDSPHNKALLAKMPKVFEIPERKAAPGRTFFQVFTTAPGLPYAPTNGAPFPNPTMQVPAGQQVPAPRLATTFTDGTSNTILIAEAGDAVEWTRPADIPYRPVGPMPRLGDPTKPSFLVAMADGTVLAVPRTVSEKTLRSAISPADGNPLGTDWPGRGAPNPRDPQQQQQPPRQRDGLAPPPLSNPVERRPPE